MRPVMEPKIPGERGLVVEQQAIFAPAAQ